MNSVVIYASRSGNTRQIAQAIADELGARGPVRLLSVDEAPEAYDGVDLVIMGGPTEAHGMTEPMKGFLARLQSGSLRRLAAAAFDTRVRWPRWLSGSAAAGITNQLRALGARVVVPAESFMVTMKPLLVPGEVARARAWASRVADAA